MNIQTALNQEVDVFVNNEQNTYRVCPWTGKMAQLVESNQRYDLYLSPNGKYYLVDNDLDGDFICSGCGDDLHDDYHIREGYCSDCI